MKITVNVSDEMVTRLELYSKKMGVSRSALCAQFIGQSVMGYDKAFDVMDTMADKMGIEKNNKQ